MYRLTSARRGLLATLAEELKKVPAYLAHRAEGRARPYVDSASNAVEFLKGENPSEDPATREKRRQHKEMYEKILREQAATADAHAAQVRDRLTWKERLQLSLANAKESLAQMTSTKAGAMALLQHCTASHAAEVALEQGIDVRHVQMVLEKSATGGSVGAETVVVGYIDAPAASREEAMAFAEKLHKACPVAHSMHIEWRHGSADARGYSDGPVRSAEELQRDMEQAARELDGAERRSSAGGSPTSATGHGSAAAASSSSPVGEAMPVGMPGSRRVHSARSSRDARGGGGGLHYEEDELHLPGLKRRHSDKARPAAAAEELSAAAAAAATAPTQPPPAPVAEAPQASSGTDNRPTSPPSSSS
ncbi:OsmC-like protein [Novymonas esmeraldas]|uniref:OsmC-like protein n=1 Tax=Novymonas esmeraldas TaxID=1808958 RepID=A0AAW0F6H0_9TRYP